MKATEVVISVRAHPGNSGTYGMGSSLKIESDSRPRVNVLRFKVVSGGALCRFEEVDSPVELNWHLEPKATRNRTKLRPRLKT